MYINIILLGILQFSATPHHEFKQNKRTNISINVDT